MASITQNSVLPAEVLLVLGALGRHDLLHLSQANPYFRHLAAPLLYEFELPSLVMLPSVHAYATTVPAPQAGASGQQAPQ